jgi:hypothetical protein
LRKNSAIRAPQSAAGALPAERGQRLDAVVIQLDLVCERCLAEAYSSLLGLPLPPPEVPLKRPCLPIG